MKRVIPLAAIGEQDRRQVGGKAFALARLQAGGFRVPEAVCISTAAYREFIAAHGLETSIRMELGRKPFADMRWEELWDASLRIRNLFLTRALPPALAADLRQALAKFEQRPVAVRSSAPEEDAAHASFAGLHESYVNLRGTEAILSHVQRVWASLWSDAALLYRQEIGLSVEESAMAVLVQELVAGQASGVAFSVSPEHRDRLTIEAVHGLNQGLVDGTVTPDRWQLNRTDLALAAHTPAERRDYLVGGPAGVSLQQLPGSLAARPPLTDEQVLTVARTALALEQFFHRPQDVEWTLRQGELHLLQARPITTRSATGPAALDDQRPWYLSLRRSFGNLKALRHKIEEDLLPSLHREGEELARRPTAPLTDAELAAEIEHRLAVYRKWHDIYWADFIPFAHGMRLFGQVYNDVMRPADPYEFVALLTGAPLLSLARNELLEQLAAQVRANPDLDRHLREQDRQSEDPKFRRLLATFTARFGDLFCATGGPEESVPCSGPLLHLIQELARRPTTDHKEEPPRPAELEHRFMQRLPDAESRRQAAEMLELARASYRLRDDDNMYLGRIEAQLEKAMAEGRRRLQKRFSGRVSLETEEVAAALRDTAFRPTPIPPNSSVVGAWWFSMP